MANLHYISIILDLLIKHCFANCDNFGSMTFNEKGHTLIPWLWYVLRNSQVGYEWVIDQKWLFLNSYNCTLITFSFPSAQSEWPVHCQNSIELFFSWMKSKALPMNMTTEQWEMLLGTSWLSGSNSGDEGKNNLLNPNKDTHNTPKSNLISHRTHI